MAFRSATAKDFQTLMLTRIFGGFFSSASVPNTGGVFGDLWSPAQREPAIAVNTVFQCALNYVIGTFQV